MSEEKAAAVAAAETPSTAETKTAVKEDDKEPSWLAARLEREQRSVLKKLGVESVDDAKKAIEDLKKLRDAEKTETERLRGEVESLRARDQRAKELEGVVALRAAAELKALTAAQQEAVMSLAGDDPSKQLRAVETLRPTWAMATESTPAKREPAAIAAPANTAPAAPAPKPAAAESDNKLATWESLQKTNPVAAAYYLTANQLEISAARQARK